MQGHIDDMTDGKITIGETLESALELGEKHENFVSSCKEVQLGIIVGKEREGSYEDVTKRYGEKL